MSCKGGSFKNIALVGCGYVADFYVNTLKNHHVMGSPRRLISTFEPMAPMVWAERS